MKRIFTLFCALCLLVSCFTAIPMTANAASNPYPYYQDVNGNGCREVRCTYYAWQQAYTRLGVALPAWGNAITWYDSARNAGYAVGTTPQANSIAVWSQDTHTMGHVAFVTAVNGSNMTVNEGGRTDREDVEGVVNGQVVPSVVGRYWWGRTLIGFIYLTTAPTVSASWTGYAEKQWVGSTNAVLAARCNLNVDASAVSSVSVYLYNNNGSQLATKTENTNISGYSFINMWFDVNSELGRTLSPGTAYKYKFSVLINGKAYYSPVYTFTTTGGHTHQYNSGAVTKQPTCTDAGVKTYTCTVCGGTKTESIAAKGHDYGSWRTVTAATCTKAGTQKRICLACFSAQQKTIEKIAHSYKNGKCSTCGKADPNKKVATIIAQPKNVVVGNGKKATTYVSATGDGLKYTWYYAKKGASKYTKSAVTTSGISVNMSSSWDGAKFYCVVTDKYGNSVKSSTATFYKGTPAKITTQPKSLTVASGKTGKLELKASGSSLKYTWYIKYKGATSWTKVGSSSKSYSFKMASKLNGAQAYCVVKDKYGISVKSSVVTIKQAPVPKVTTQPKSVTQVSGKTASFSVKASGEGLKYQWYYAKKGSSSFKKLSGATKATYSVKVSSSVSGRKYYCLVTDKYGQTVKSSAVTLTMKTVAKITTQPKSVTVKNGSTAKVTIKAVGDGLKYTWYYLKPGATKYAKSSITSATFSVKMAAAWKNAKVYCVIADKYGNTVKSSVATLKMK